MPASVPPKCLVGDRGEGLVGALEDPLGADVDPRTRGHLAVHGEPERLEATELRPRRPVAARGWSSRSARAAPTRGSRSTPTGRPDWTSIVSSPFSVVSVRTSASKLRQSRAARPVPAVDDEVVGPLGDLGVEVVLQHPQRAPPGASPSAESRAVRAARTGRAPSMTSSLAVQCHVARRDVEQFARRHELARPRRSRARATGRGRARPRRALTRSAIAGRSRATGSSGARSARARAPASSSIATTSAKGVEGLAELPRRVPAHRDVVLLHTRRGDRVDARRRRQTLHLRHQSRLGVLGDHQPRVDAGVLGEERRKPVTAIHVEHAIGATLGHRGDVGERDGEEVERVADGRAVEVAVGHQRAVREHRGVVDGRGQLDVGDVRGVRRRCRARRRGPGARSAASRRPAPGWGRPGASSRSASPRAARRGSPRCHAGPGAGATRGSRRGRPVRAAQGLDRERRREVDLSHQRVRVVEGEDQLTEHAVGAVDEREALLLGEHHRRETGVGERVRGPTARRPPRRARHPRPSAPTPRARAARGRPNSRANRTRARRA